MSSLVIIIAAFVGVTALVGGVAVLIGNNKEEKVGNRLTKITSTKKSSSSEQSVLRDGSTVNEGFKAGHSFLEGLLLRMSRLSLLFEQANTSLTPSKFLLVSGGTAAAAGFSGMMSGLHPAIIPVMAAFGSVLPLFWLMFRRKRRMKKFAAQLPDALELIARALRAGHSLAAGFQLVGQEMSEPICQDFMRVFEEQNLGITLDDAMESMTDRVPNLDLKFFCTAVVLQRQTGGDLAEILDKIGRLVRERFKIQGQVQALTGEGRLSGVVLLALPPVLFITVYNLNAEYVSVLFTDPMGTKMLMGGVIMQFLGALVIRKIINIRI